MKSVYYLNTNKGVGSETTRWIADKLWTAKYYHTFIHLMQFPVVSKSKHYKISNFTHIIGDLQLLFLKHFELKDFKFLLQKELKR